MLTAQAPDIDPAPATRFRYLRGHRAGPQHAVSQDFRILTFSQRKPEDGITVLAFVQRLDNGGYLLVEAAEPGAVHSLCSKFIPWNDATVVPVTDVAESVERAAESVAWGRAASGG
jgi:hypothetical protein